MERERQSEDQEMLLTYKWTENEQSKFIKQRKRERKTNVRRRVR